MECEKHWDCHLTYFYPPTITIIIPAQDVVKSSANSRDVVAMQRAKYNKNLKNINQL